MPWRADNRGMTFVEVMAATVIIGLLAAALQNATGFILNTEEEAATAWIAHELGISLLEEIAATAFADPQTASSTLGLDAGEWPDPSMIPDHVDLPDPVDLSTPGGPGGPGGTLPVVPPGSPVHTPTAKTRARFDDVDDYTVWDGSYPLQHKNGRPMGIPGYRRQVEVVYVSPGNYAATSLVATGHKRITVRVLKEGVIVGEFTTVRVQGGRHVDYAG